MSASRARTRPPIAVVHLVWGPLGPAPLRRFLASYKSHPAGADHDLIVLLNGVEEGEREELLAELEGVEHRVLDVPGRVQDLAAYEHAANVLEHERLCFLNSYSEFLAGDWLGHFERALDRAQVGLVGASGSWASMLSLGLYNLGLPSIYSEIYDDRRSTARAFEQMILERSGGTPPPDELRRALQSVLALRPFLFGFGRFPAPHVRTNAFAIDRALLLRLARWSPRRKTSSYRLESGRASLTAQVERTGLRALVVDRRGELFEVPEWPDSETFWQGEQRGLLIADNQTALYAEGDPERRLLLARCAWGSRATS